MKQKLILILLIAFSCNTALPNKKAGPSLLSKIYNSVKLPVSPSEVSHTLDIVRTADEPYRLDSDRIDQLRKMYEENFKTRARLAQATYMVSAGSLLWLGYKWGLFNWILPSSANGEISSSNNLENLDPAKTTECLKIVIENLKRMHAQLEEAKKDATSGNWFINGAKYVGWTGVSIAGSLIVSSKWQSFFNFALAQASFKWFLSSHSMLATIDRLKRSVQALSVGNNAEFVKEYHAKALIPVLEAIIRNTEQYIGFIDYYLPLLEDDVVKKEAMDDVSRYLFNITNDFLKKVNPILKEQSNQSALLPVIDEYRADIATVISRCKMFEEEFYPEV